MRESIAAVGAKTAFIEPGSPWENGYCESFNSKLCDELLNSEIFYSLAEARVIIEAWRRYYNTERPTHRSDIDHRAGGHRLAFNASRIASTSSASNGRKAHHALRLKPDHLIGAGQSGQSARSEGALPLRGQ